MTGSEWNDAPGKFQDDAEYFEDPDGNIDWRARIRRASRVDGTHIHEKSGKCVRDYDCGCHGGKPDGGQCYVGGRRVCAEHSLLCSNCGRPSCQRHRTLVNGLPVCHACFQTESNPDFFLCLAIALFALVLYLFIGGR
jgi:hypothetical protein